MLQNKVLVLLLVAIPTTLGKNIRCPGNLSTDAFVENLLDSTKFFKCTSEGRLQPLKCDEGLEFSAKLQVCQKPQERQTVKFTNTICNHTRNGYIVANYTNDCLSFLLCDNGNEREISCGNGYKFNPLVNHCDFESNVVCNCVGPQCPPFGEILSNPLMTPCPCLTTTACPCRTTTACPCQTTTACPCKTTTPTCTTCTTSEYSTPGYTLEEPFCILTTPPPEEDECVEGVPDEHPVFHHTTPPPDTVVCAEGNPDELEFVYCPPGKRC